MTRQILVTSALPYANGPIHLGHMSAAAATRAQRFVSAADVRRRSAATPHRARASAADARSR
jgi:hypothetical protein